MGVNVRQANLRTRNVAAVIVTADLAPFRRARHAHGRDGVLARRRLLADGRHFAVDLAERRGWADLRHFAGRGGGHRLCRAGTGGDADARACRRRDGCPMAPPSNAKYPPACRTTGPLSLQLRNPDFATAVRIADAINAYAWVRYRRRGAAHEESPNAVMLVQAAGRRRDPFRRRDRRIAGRARHARAGGGGCAHRHGGDRPGRADFAGRGHAGLADRARERNAAGFAARALLATGAGRW